MELIQRRRGLIGSKGEPDPDRNLFNPAEHTMKAQHMINYTTGGLTGLSNTTRKYVETYVRVRPQTEYIISTGLGTFGTGSNFGTAFYDADKTYISGFANNGSNSMQFTTPADCTFLRFSLVASESIQEVISEITLKYA